MKRWAMKIKGVEVTFLDPLAFEVEADTEDEAFDAADAIATVVVRGVIVDANGDDGKGNYVANYDILVIDESYDLEEVTT